jgi:glycosyltransferase involved in cell wall biosynthesis
MIAATNRATKKVAIVGTAGVPARYGGFETLAECLCEHLETFDLDVAVYCTGRLYPERHAKYRGAELRYLPLEANGWQSLLYDALSICHALWKRADTLLLLGVSGAFLLPLVRLLSPARVVTNIDGIESRREKWGPFTRQILRALEWFAVRFSHAVIADNEGIRQYVAERYGVDAEVIAYGGDHVAPRGNEPAPAFAGRYALLLARIEPENNIETILRAFAGETVRREFSLVAIGNWAASEYGRDLKARYGGRDGYVLLDAIYDRDKVRSLRAHAAVYLHGHSAGGTNPSLVEAMFFRAPIAAFDCSFNRYTLAGLGAYFRSAEGLEAVLSGPGAAVDADTREVRALARARYTWSTIAERYATVLGAEATQVLGGRPDPEAAPLRPTGSDER